MNINSLIKLFTAELFNVWNFLKFKCYWDKVDSEQDANIIQYHGRLKYMSSEDW